MEKKVTTKLEKWDPYDPRLPQTKDLKRPVPDTATLESLKEVQLQPIGVGYDEDLEEYFLIFGRSRIRGFRENAEKNDGVSRKIDVLVFRGVTRDDIPRLSIEENHHRSPNPLTDWVAIQECFRRDGNATYETVAEELRITVAQVKQIEKSWGKAPKWVVNAAIRGEMSMSTAKAISNLSTEKQAKLKDHLKDEGSVTSQTVKEINFFTTRDLVGADMFAPQAKKFFSRNEIEKIHEMVSIRTKTEVLAYLDSLLKELE